MSDVESEALGGFNGTFTVVTQVESAGQDQIRVRPRNLTFKNGILETSYPAVPYTVRTRRQVADGPGEPELPPA